MLSLGLTTSWKADENKTIDPKRAGTSEERCAKQKKAISTISKALRRAARVRYPSRYVTRGTRSLLSRFHATRVHDEHRNRVRSPNILTWRFDTCRLLTVSMARLPTTDGHPSTSKTDHSTRR
jgi:hypothetical protein